MKKKSKLESLTKKQISEMEKQAETRSNVPLLKGSQVNMRLHGDTLLKAKKLAQAQGIPYTSFLKNLLKEDIDRLWKVFKKGN